MSFTIMGDISLEFRITIKVPEGGDDRAAHAAARAFLIELAGALVQCAAAVKDRDTDVDIHKGDT